jgi:trans-aconitate 2-methyltransferase
MTTWNAQDYHKNSSEQQKWARELIEKLALRGDESVLDIGCGDGKVTAEIASRLPRGCVVGIDRSQQMIDFAASNFPTSLHTNLSLAQMDASELNFENRFDVVFSNAVLHWIVDHRPVLQGIARALKAGGRVLLQMGGHGNAARVLAAVDSVMHEDRWRSYFEDFHFRYGFYSPQEYRPWLAEAGLNAGRLELIPKDMLHENVDRFAGWFRTTWMPWIDCVTEDRRNEFIKTVIARYTKENPPDAHGRVLVRMIRLEVECG